MKFFRWLKGLFLNKKNDPWKLWIDDQWDEEDMYSRHPPLIYTPARSSQEAIELCRKLGLPTDISFDHDLGGDDNSTVFIRMMIDEFYDEDAPRYMVHSSNPVGRENIISLMESWKRSKEL